MRLNNSPILTTRNYGINDAKVDDSVFCQEITPFENIIIENADSFFNKNAKKISFSKKIGGDFDLQLSQNNNAVLNFEIDKSQENPICISFKFDENNKMLVEQIVFNIKENVDAKLIVSLSGEVDAYHNGIVKINCEKNSKAEMLFITDFEKESVNVLRFENSVDEASKLKVSLVDFANGHSIINYYSKLNGDESKSILNCVYVAGGKTFVDLNFEQDVFGKKSEASIQTVGALLAEARKHFKGTINFEKGCKKSSGSEDELCLLLSKNAKSKALPMLLCTEEDVDGKHASSVGKVSEKELFYIMSRGFSRQDAIKLVVKAKFNIVLENLFDVKLKQKLIDLVDRKLNYEE